MNKILAPLLLAAQIGIFISCNNSKIEEDKATSNLSDKATNTNSLATKSVASTINTDKQNIPNSAVSSIISNQTSLSPDANKDTSKKTPTLTQNKTAANPANTAKKREVLLPGKINSEMDCDAIAYKLKSNKKILEKAKLSNALNDKFKSEIEQLQKLQKTKKCK